MYIFLATAHTALGQGCPRNVALLLFGSSHVIHLIRGWWLLDSVLSLYLLITGTFIFTVFPIFLNLCICAFEHTFQLSGDTNPSQALIPKALNGLVENMPVSGKPTNASSKPYTVPSLSYLQSPQGREPGTWRPSS